MITGINERQGEETVQEKCSPSGVFFEKENFSGKPFSLIPIVQSPQKKSLAVRQRFYDCLVNLKLSFHFRDDYSLASLGTSRQEMTEIFIALQSAAESGWYFSSRWINVRGDNKG